MVNIERSIRTRVFSARLHAARVDVCARAPAAHARAIVRMLMVDILQQYRYVIFGGYTHGSVVGSTHTRRRTHIVLQQ